MVKYWLKIIRDDFHDNSFVRIVYQKLLGLSKSHPQYTTWVSLLKNFLETTGFGEYWVRQRVVNEAKFLSEIKQRLHDIYLQDWSSEVNKTSDNRLFKHIKTAFGYEM